MQILILNIPTDLDDDALKSMFDEFGSVASAVVGKDKKTGASEGYGIVDMPVKHEARESIEALNGKEMKGKTIRVRMLRHDDPFTGGSKGGGKFVPGGGQTRGATGFHGRGIMRRGGQRGS